MTRRALVLGAGGHAAIAWEIGGIAGLTDAGVDVRHADLFLGTSAGSIVAAQITSGLALDELFQRQVDPRLQVDEPAPSVDFPRWRADIMHAREGASTSIESLQRLGSLTAPNTSEYDRRTVIASRMPAHVWPEQNLLIVAVDADSGERRTFDRTIGVHATSETPVALLHDSGVH
jgi:NTE family protein